MTLSTDVRCEAPHPSVSGWTCRGKLTRAVPGTVRVERGSEPPPGCTVLRCRRCGREYIACPVTQ